MGGNMGVEQKYLIKYVGDASKQNLYWLKDKEKWITDPSGATQFINPEGINEVGRLLVEHEWVTCLILAEEIRTVKKVTKIKRSPIIVQEIENEGCETIYLVCNHAYIQYEDETGTVSKKYTISTDGKFYRKSENSNHPGVLKISTCSPTDFTFVTHYFEPIEEEKP